MGIAGSFPCAACVILGTVLIYKRWVRGSAIHSYLRKSEAKPLETWHLAFPQPRLAFMLAEMEERRFLDLYFSIAL